MTLASAQEMTDRNDRSDRREADVALGEDWVGPASGIDPELLDRRARRGFITLNRSPLARKIITFNLLALILLVSGVLYLNPYRDTLVAEREDALRTQAVLVAEVIEVQMPLGAPVNLATGDGIDIEAALDRVNLPAGTSLRLFDATGNPVTARDGPPAEARDERPTVLTDALVALWRGTARLVGARPDPDGGHAADPVPGLVAGALDGSVQAQLTRDAEGRTGFAVAVPLAPGGRISGAVALSGAAGEIDALVRAER